MSEKVHFVSKVTFVVVCLHCVCANYFHIFIFGKSFSRILVQFPHELSTTVFVLIKNFLLSNMFKKSFISAMLVEKIVLFYHVL